MRRLVGAHGERLRCSKETACGGGHRARAPVALGLVQRVVGPSDQLPAALCTVPTSNPDRGGLTARGRAAQRLDDADGLVCVRVAWPIYRGNGER